MDQGTGRTRDDLTPPTILISCPLAEEYRCVEDALAQCTRRIMVRWKRTANTPRSNLFDASGCGLYVVQSGLGVKSADCLKRLIPQENIDAVWLLGFAGALDPSLLVGDTIEPNHLRHGQYGDRVALTTIGVADRQEAIVTIDEVASTPTEKALLRRQFDCFAVDMEAFPLAKLCESRGIPFHTARAISDAANETFPKELNGIILPSGDLSIKRLAWAVLKKPTLICPLYRLWRNSRKAKEGLRLIVRRLVEKLA